jgi:hypothetical protein
LIAGRVAGVAAAVDLGNLPYDLGKVAAKTKHSYSGKLGSTNTAIVMALNQKGSSWPLAGMDCFPSSGPVGELETLLTEKIEVVRLVAAHREYQTGCSGLLAAKFPPAYDSSSTRPLRSVVSAIERMVRMFLQTSLGQTHWLLLLAGQEFQ